VGNERGKGDQHPVVMGKRGEQPVELRPAVGPVEPEDPGLVGSTGTVQILNTWPSVASSAAAAASALVRSATFCTRQPIITTRTKGSASTRLVGLVRGVLRHVSNPDDVPYAARIRVQNVRGVVPGERLIDARPPRSGSPDRGSTRAFHGRDRPTEARSWQRQVADNAPHEDGDMCELANRTADE
jgi:hypothetical protein